MKILILGGTGAMGRFLVNVLDDGTNKIIVSSRSNHADNGNISYVKGNAKNIEFVKKVLSEDSFDAVVDFMSYKTSEFSERYNMFLSLTKQYVFISSARVYSKSDTLITEDTPRLLDVSEDKKYLKTDEYALAKARCEDILRKSGCNNWTIIRPSLTYGDARFQLGVLEKENWLYRALRGRSIVFSADIADKLTAMTSGRDVARGIASLLGKTEALGEIFHITCNKSYSWRTILDSYCKILEKYDVKPKIVMVPITQKLYLGGRNNSQYQVIYYRYYNRTFDNSKIGAFVDVESFADPLEGLSECLSSFLKKAEFGNIDWRLEAISDRMAKEHTPLSEIHGLKNRICYLCYRYHFGFLIAFLQRCRAVLHSI